MGNTPKQESDLYLGKILGTLRCWINAVRKFLTVIGGKGVITK